MKDIGIRTARGSLDPEAALRDFVAGRVMRVDSVVAGMPTARPAPIAAAAFDAMMRGIVPEPETEVPGFGR